MKRFSFIIPLLVLTVFACFLPSCVGEETPAEPTVTVIFSVDGVNHPVTVRQGEIPVCPVPTDKAPEGDTRHTFIGWSPDIVPATTPVTYTAQYTTETVPTYSIRFRLRDITVTVRTWAGEIPAAPEVPQIDNDGQTLVFSAWDKELAPATADVMYRAQYRAIDHLCDVIFRIGNTEVRKQLLYGSPISYDGEIPTVPGKTFFWDRDLTTVSHQEEIFYGCYAEPALADALRQALASAPVAFDDGETYSFYSASAFLYLAEEEYSHPGANPVVAHRLRQHIGNVLSGGKEPSLNAEPAWSYAPFFAAMALVRLTPTVWNILTEEEIARADCLMRAAAALSCFATADRNYYLTGPGLTGNYSKTWNPNYRIANVTPILFATLYFGVGDAVRGAAIVNRELLAFDYDVYMADFARYGFTQIRICWLAAGKQLMEEGGAATLHDGSFGGYGVGVRTEYTYGKHPLSDLSGIYTELIAYCYAGGPVFSDSADMPGGKRADGTSKAYILDGTTSPWEGKYGLMLEFNGSDGGGLRSSLSYCRHDFNMVVGTFFALRLLGVWDENTYPSVFANMRVGNDDVIYKAEHGYMSHDKGGSYAGRENADGGWYLWKALWQYTFPSIS